MPGSRPGIGIVAWTGKDDARKRKGGSLRASAIIGLAIQKGAAMKTVINKDLIGDTTIKDKVIDIDSYEILPNIPYIKFMKDKKAVCLISTDLVKTIDFER